jgi:ribonuclease HI
MEVILNVPPLELIIQHLAINSYDRLNLKPRYWSGKRGKTLGHIIWLRNMSKPLPPRHFQDRCAHNRWYQTYTTHIGDGEDITQENGILCYTDGSGHLTGSGSGQAVYQGNYPDPIYEASEYTGQATVFQAKVHAIKMACDYAMQMVPAQVIILSDSQAAILALTKSNFTSRTVLTTADALQTLARQGVDVRVQWIRGHNGTPGNELADYMPIKVPLRYFTDQSLSSPYQRQWLKPLSNRNFKYYG